MEVTSWLHTVHISDVGNVPNQQEGAGAEPLPSWAHLCLRSEPGGGLDDHQVGGSFAKNGF